MNLRGITRDRGSARSIQLDQHPHLAGEYPAVFYSIHAAGGQAIFIMPTQNLALFLKREHEFRSYAHTLGNTLVFGGCWTLPNI